MPVLIHLPPISPTSSPKNHSQSFISKDHPHPVVIARRSQTQRPRGANAEDSVSAVIQFNTQTSRRAISKEPAVVVSKSRKMGTKSLSPTTMMRKRDAPDHQHHQEDEIVVESGVVTTTTRQQSRMREPTSPLILGEEQDNSAMMTMMMLMELTGTPATPSSPLPKSLRRSLKKDATKFSSRPFATGHVFAGLAHGLSPAELEILGNQTRIMEESIRHRQELRTASPYIRAQHCRNTSSMQALAVNVDGFSENILNEMPNGLNSILLRSKQAVASPFYNSDTMTMSHYYHPSYSSMARSATTTPIVNNSNNNNSLSIHHNNKTTSSSLPNSPSPQQQNFYRKGGVGASLGSSAGSGKLFRGPTLSQKHSKQFPVGVGEESDGNGNNNSSIEKVASRCMDAVERVIEEGANGSSDNENAHEKQITAQIIAAIEVDKTTTFASEK